jgi:Na+/H+ antiporter NhaD/arsenite permease-like protein
MGSTMFLLFIAGVIAIAFEDKIRVNKAAVAVGLSIILWTMLIETENVDQSVINSLGNVSTTLFFVLASMAIIEIVDSHGAFNVILSLIKTRNKRKLLWIFSILTFTFSAVLGNLATVIIMVTLIRRMVIYKEDRLIFSSMIIIAANAGGSWSPIGDVTTLILWTGGNITVWSQIYHVILSALTMMIVPLSFVTFMFGKEDSVQYFEEDEDDYVISHITPFFKKAILIVGSASGVTVMGMEKFPFSYYFKKFTPLALLGYVAGAAVYMILF